MLLRSRRYKCLCRIILSPTIPQLDAQRGIEPCSEALAERGVKGRKSLVGDFKGATPPWILRELGVLPPKPWQMAPAPPLRPRVVFLGIATGAFVGARTSEDATPEPSLQMPLSYHPLASHPPNQLDAQRGIEPCSEALAERGVKGRKSLVGDFKGATPPWILRELGVLPPKPW